ncbi:hypothetical protein MMC13_000835 [Lambiella insularis]|nr:hypothetical protein [Lambiella insularis]
MCTAKGLQRFYCGHYSDNNGFNGVIEPCAEYSSTDHATRKHCDPLSPSMERPDVNCYTCMWDEKIAASNYLTRTGEEDYWTEYPQWEADRGQHSRVPEMFAMLRKESEDIERMSRADFNRMEEINRIREEARKRGF